MYQFPFTLSLPFSSSPPSSFPITHETYEMKRFHVFTPPVSPGPASCSFLYKHVLLDTDSFNQKINIGLEAHCSFPPFLLLRVLFTLNSLLLSNLFTPIESTRPVIISPGRPHSYPPALTLTLFDRYHGPLVSVHAVTTTQRYYALNP